ncbi:UBX domain-containing protein [Aphelenchoides avenae]|nr:UBX domain-containing protein [Aphelenchus avenae]
MPNIATLASVKGNQSNGGGGGSGSDSEDEGRPPRQAFYAGGSEHSGQQVLGPGADAAERLFEAARKAGAEQLNPDEAAEAMGSSSRGASQVQGGVYRLGGHGMASESLSTGGASREQPNAPVRIRMNVWENGFSLDDGPLRAFDDPQSRPFLMAVAAGRIPPELVQQYPGRQVDIHMERRSSPYVAPKPKPFSGDGYRLGSPSPAVVAAAAPVAPEPSQEGIGNTLKPSFTNNLDQEKLLKTAQEGVKLKDGEPTTRLQIRLPSGQRLTANFNNTHTVTDVRTFAVTAVPSLEFQPFQLMTTFPNKVIENEQESLKDAGLINAVVVVKPHV